MLAAASTWLALWAAACSFSIRCSVSTWVNCAVWVRNCVLSAGFIGSWYFSCATSSLRNVSWLSWFASVVFAVGSVGAVWLADVALGDGVHGGHRCSSDTHVE